MFDLGKTDHQYYFDASEKEGFATWKDFKKFRGNDLKPWDEVMLVRYDYEEWGLELHFVGQRKGYTWTAVIEKVEEKNIPDINEFLKNAWAYLQDLWKEISLDNDINYSVENHVQK